jgi:uncharacterized protein
VIHLGPGVVALLVAAGFLAGAVNAIAGGGSLISFPALLLAGLPAITANVTNTVALLPGYLSGSGAAHRLLTGQTQRMRTLVPVAAAGSVTGAWLLVHSAAHFRGVVPWLILTACLLLGAQPRLSRWIQPRADRPERAPAALLATFAAGAYGAFFGAGLGVMLLAALTLLLRDSLPRLNALKQALSLLITAVAAIWFAAGGGVAWEAVPLVGAGAIAGAVAGFKLSGRLDPAVLRWLVVTLGTGIAVRMLVP